MDDNLHLHVTHSLTDGKSRRVTRLTSANAAPIEIFYQFETEMPWAGDDTLLDGHALAILLYAMQQGKTLVVHGPLSRSFMRNIEEMQLAWHCWRPEKYHKITIQPDRIVDARRIVGNEKAISAFSGGVDGTFTAICHAKSLPESARYPLTSVLLVHGFDVKLANPHYFDQLVGRVQPVLKELDLDLRIIRTNSKELQLQFWEDSFGFELAACMHMFSDEFQYGLMGSGEPYDMLVFPWGSTPATCFLKSGDQFTMVHDGAGFSRTDKVAHIARYPVVCKNLKVCWMGEVQSANCGKCEKCIRTRLNFLASGNPIPPCFPTEFDISSIATMSIRNTVQLCELQSLVAYARKHGVTGDWLPITEKRIADHQSCLKKAQLKSAVIAALAAVGLKEPLKKLWHCFR